MGAFNRGLWVGTLLISLTGCAGIDLPLPDWARSLLGQAPEQPAVETPLPRPRPRKRRVVNGQVVLTPVASDGVLIETNPQALYRAYAVRNMAFDRMRSQALLLLEQGRTTEAVALLQKARVARPDDTTIGPLIELANRPPDLPSMPDGVPMIPPDPREGGLDGSSPLNGAVESLIRGKKPDIAGGLGKP